MVRLKSEATSLNVDQEVKETLKNYSHQGVQNGIGTTSGDESKPALAGHVRSQDSKFDFYSEFEEIK